MQEYSALPPRAALSIGIALLLSLVLNIVTINLKVPTFYRDDRDRVLRDSHSSLPFRPQRAAFTVLDTEDHVDTSFKVWEPLSPPGGGFVRIDGEYYLVAMYHQIHCLNGLRRYMQEYRNGTLEMTEGKKYHVTHCLSYLRQSVLCNLDVTLEPAREAVTEKGEHVHAAYGTGVEHECRDWAQIREWVGKNHEEWADEDDFEIT